MTTEDKLNAVNSARTQATAAATAQNLATAGEGGLLLASAGQYNKAILASNKLQFDTRQADRSYNLGLGGLKLKGYQAQLQYNLGKNQLAADQRAKQYQFQLGEDQLYNQRAIADQAYNLQTRIGDQTYFLQRHQGDERYDLDRRKSEQEYDLQSRLGDQAFELQKYQGDQSYNLQRYLGARGIDLERDIVNQNYSLQKGRSDQAYDIYLRQGDQSFALSREQNEISRERNRQQFDLENRRLDQSGAILSSILGESGSLLRQKAKDSFTREYHPSSTYASGNIITEVKKDTGGEIKNAKDKSEKAVNAILAKQYQDIQDENLTDKQLLTRYKDIRLENRGHLTGQFNQGYYAFESNDPTAALFQPTGVSTYRENRSTRNLSGPRDFSAAAYVGNVITQGDGIKTGDDIGAFDFTPEPLSQVHYSTTFHDPSKNIRDIYSSTNEENRRRYEDAGRQVLAQYDRDYRRTQDEKQQKRERAANIVSLGLYGLFHRRR